MTDPVEALADGAAISPDGRAPPSLQRIKGARSVAAGRTPEAPKPRPHSTRRKAWHANGPITE
jgi:hypothetical protein